LNFAFKEEIIAILTPFYSVFNAGVDPTAAISSVTTSDWLSCGNGDVGCQTVAQIVSSFIVGFGSIVVRGSITFKFEDIVIAGNSVLVRGELSAIPLSIDQPPFNFFNPARTRFTIMTQDIHTIKDGKISRTYHIEDFVGAIGQIKAANPHTFPVGPIARVNLLSNFIGLAFPNFVNGTITFTQHDDTGIVITGFVHNLMPGKHGWHIHEFGIDDTLAGSDICSGAGGHFNPTGVVHGDINAGHAGDIGNLIADMSGNFVVPTSPPVVLKLTTVAAIEGRTLVIHANMDDFSDPVGNSGPRLACGNIHLVPSK